MLTKEIEEMSVEKRLELAAEIWESVGMDDQWDESVPQWQREILEERMKYSLQHPNEAIPWEEVMKELQSRFGG